MIEHVEANDGKVELVALQRIDKVFLAALGKLNLDARVLGPKGAKRITDAIVLDKWQGSKSDECLGASFAGFNVC